MSSVLLYHPLGLGDHLVCAGIVREYARHHDLVGVFCFEVNYPSVAFLYRDLANVRIERIRSHRDAARLKFYNRFHVSTPHYDRVQVVGTFNVESGVQYERQFYKMAGVPLEKLWDNFHVERDAAREQRLLQTLEAQGPYQFIHDDVRFPVDPRRLSSLRQVRPAREIADTIFDYCAIIERAAEVHVIDSSFMFLIDCLPYQSDAQKLFVHRYTRPNMAWNLPILKKPWTILT